MKIFNFKTLWQVAVSAVLCAVCWVGCGGEDNPSGDDNDGNNTGSSANNCISADLCKSAVMPDGKTWMTENLNIATTESWCYNDSPDSCVKYGRLYTWSAAMLACQSIGWRLPDTSDWNKLVDAVGGWNNDGNGTDKYGFSALPGGGRSYKGHFFGAGDCGLWWMATERIDDDGHYNVASFRSVSYCNVVDEDEYDRGVKECGFSVRCIAD